MENGYHFFLYLIGRQAFTTLHMMYHEATACHVTGDLTEVLMILHNLLVCCRPHSNKPGTHIFLCSPITMHIIWPPKKYEMKGLKYGNIRKDSMDIKFVL